LRVCVLNDVRPVSQNSLTFHGDCMKENTKTLVKIDATE
jgi:hypothetical protein